MNLKFWYIKFIGLLLVIFGFGYSLTAFYNLFDTLWGSKIIEANTNLWITGFGVVFPLFVFIFGVLFYFYGDFYKEEPSKPVFACSIIVIIIGIFKLLLINEVVSHHLSIINTCMDFVHPSFGYISLLMGILLIAGHIKFKY